VQIVRRGLIALASAATSLVLAGPASADAWLPHPAGATWVYQWQDSVYSPTLTTEKVTVGKTSGADFVLAWTTNGQNNAAGAVTSQGTVSFQETATGLNDTEWTSSAPPPSFPILCAAITSCGNSLASALYNVIWGTRAPLLEEPLLKGVSWTSTGGTQNDVSSSSEYLGVVGVSVPAFPRPVAAAEVRTEISQAGALGDPYGSGVRTVWWVYGVGPVKVVFDHSGGAGAPVTTVELQSTDQKPLAPPPDLNYFPYTVGATGVYRWTNSRYLKQPELERFKVAQAVNGTALIDVASVSGPLKVAGSYQFTTGLNGVISDASATKAASLAAFPPLGPAALPAGKRRHFFTPFDLMTFGFGPVLPAYPAAGATWRSSRTSRDFAVYGVSGSSRVVGVRLVKVPAGTFLALVVTSTLEQPGFPFGSGTRTSWFAPGRGLVKLVFRHGDGSVSVVELAR
jgi:hypothetical protein